MGSKLGSDSKGTRISVSCAWMRSRSASKSSRSWMTASSSRSDLIRLLSSLIRGCRADESWSSIVCCSSRRCWIRLCSVSTTRNYVIPSAGSQPTRPAEELTADDIPTPKGKTKWAPSTIQSMLTNEKYKGDALAQKPSPLNS